MNSCENLTAQTSQTGKNNKDLNLLIQDLYHTQIIQTVPDLFAKPLHFLAYVDYLIKYIQIQIPAHLLAMQLEKSIYGLFFGSNTVLLLTIF